MAVPVSVEAKEGREVDSLEHIYTFRREGTGLKCLCNKNGVIKEEYKWPQKKNG